MGGKVLMIDDELELGQATTEYLTLCGFPATHIADAEHAEDVIAREQPDLILLDINLPGDNGFELCRTVRQKSQVPIIFISARDSDSDQILALDLGGDDFIIKPFSLNVLLAKIRRILERVSAQKTTAADAVDDWLTINLSAHRVWVNGKELMIPATEFRLLELLVKNQGALVSKQQCLDHVWGGSFVSEGTLSVHIRRLRTRIERNPDRPTYIRTFWGRGYLFAQPGS